MRGRRGRTWGAGIALAISVALASWGGCLHARTQAPNPARDVILAAWGAPPNLTVVAAVANRGLDRLEPGIEGKFTASAGDVGPAVVALGRTDVEGIAVVEFQSLSSGKDRRLEASWEGGRQSAVLSCDDCASPADAGVEGPSPEPGGLRVRVEHESGVPVAGIDNELRVTVTDEAGRPVAGEVRIEGLMRDPQVGAADDTGCARFRWDPATVPGDARLGHSGGPRAEVRVRAADARDGTLRFDPMRPRPGTGPAWRPDPERRARGADGKARLLLRISGTGADARAVVACAEPGGAVAVCATGGPGPLRSEVRRIDALTTRFDLPLAGATEVHAVRILPDGSVAWDARVLATGGTPCSPSAVHVASSRAQTLAAFESGRDDAEEAWRAFSQTLFFVGATLAACFAIGVVWLVPAGLCARRFGRLAGVAWAVAAALPIPLAVLAAEARWLPKPWRMPAVVAAVAALWLSAIAGYALHARHARARWAGWVAAALAALAAWALPAR